MTTPLLNEILQMSISERLELIGNIWDSIAEIPDAIELTEDKKQELSYRLELYKNNLAYSSTWDEVKQIISQKI